MSNGAILPTVNDLSPFDPSKPSIGVNLADGKVSCVNREFQYTNAYISLEMLGRLLGIPVDHHAVRVAPMGDHHPPGILLMIEGPSGHLTPYGVPVAIEGWDHFIADVDARRERAAQYWLNEAVERKHATQTSNEASQSVKGFGS